MMFSGPPSALRQKTLTRIESGMEIAMTVCFPIAEEKRKS
jgi:hypothetical protein